MKRLGSLVLLTILVVFVSTVTCGQSLVMTGNEIFEQDVPKKNADKKKPLDKVQIEIKQHKQGKPIIIPSIKQDNQDKNKKEKLSTEKTEKGQKFTSLAEAPTIPVIPRANYKYNFMFVLISLMIFLKQVV